jgi:hypothetical protein
LGIGDWAQSPIPNPQSPIPKVDNIFNVLIKVNRNKKKYLNHLTLILQENTITFLF